MKVIVCALSVCPLKDKTYFEDKNLMEWPTNPEVGKVKEESELI
jgi:hypothetical protein